MADLVISIRPEKAADAKAIADMVQRAFAAVSYSDHTEHEMVERLRGCAAYIPDLALVACRGSSIVGHVMLTKVSICEGDRRFPSLALAPLSVIPGRQRQGVGRALVLAACGRALTHGHTSIVLLGSAHYYRRFGFEPARAHGITMPFAVNDENCMVLPLVPDALTQVRGMVEYPPAWTAR